MKTKKNKVFRGFENNVFKPKKSFQYRPLRQMKIINYIIVFCILASFVSAEQIIIFDFSYDKGLITLTSQSIQEGYYPDRKIQPEEGYKCALADNNDNTIYDFKFEIPLKVYTDVINKGNIEGNVIRLNETEFSLIMPFLEKAEKIKCYNIGGYEIINKEIEKIPLSPEKSNFNIWIFVLVALAVLFFIIFRRKKREQR